MLAKIFTSLVLAVTVATALVVVAEPTAYAAGSDVISEACKSNPGGPNAGICAKSQALFGPDSIWTKIINALIYVIGAVAVLMIVIGGLRYTISSGDSGQLTSAKNTILYAVVGLIIAVMAYAIVNFVLSKI